MMTDTTTTPVELAERRHFRRQWHRSVIPSVVAIATFGLFAYRIPDGLGIAIPGICFILALCGLMHGGLIVSRDGIEWYVLRPKWRYRKIPWHAVLDARRNRFRNPEVRLVVESGRYEPWVWGTPRRDRVAEIPI